MSDNRLVNTIRENARLDRIWMQLTTEQKRKVLEFAEGDLGLAEVALEDERDV